MDVIPEVVEYIEKVETYPAVPRPTTVEANELLKKEVETKFAKLAVETTPETLDR